MSTTQISLRYREGQFTPSETAAITGTPLHLQRDWRSQGLLRARQGGRASFTPRELAEMRLMMRLRGLGVSLSDAKRAAVEAAPGDGDSAGPEEADRQVRRFRDFLDTVRPEDFA